MNATQLHLESGKPAGVFFCGKCKMVASSSAAAEECCRNYSCSKCGGETGGRTWRTCDACRAKEAEEKERSLFRQAEKLTEWDGWVFYGGEFYESVDDALEACEGRAPSYVWACKPKHFVKASVGDVVERMVDDAWEDWDWETLDGLDELKEALGKFNEANKSVCSYTPDYSKAVLTRGSLR